MFSLYFVSIKKKKIQNQYQNLKLIFLEVILMSYWHVPRFSPGYFLRTLYTKPLLHLTWATTSLSCPLLSLLTDSSFCTNTVNMIIFRLTVLQLLHPSLPVAVLSRSVSLPKKCCFTICERWLKWAGLQLSDLQISTKNQHLYIKHFLSWQPSSCEALIYSLAIPSSLSIYCCITQKNLSNK